MLKGFSQNGPGSQVEQEKVMYLKTFFAGVPGPSDGMGSNTQVKAKEKCHLPEGGV